MAETGDAINIANLQRMISSVTAFGGVYAPSNAEIELSKLQNKLDAANAALDSWGAAAADQDSVETDRENLFKPLGPTATRSFNYYESTGAKPNKIADAREFRRKIQGKRAKAITPPTGDTPTKKTISVSQQSYTQKIEHFDGMIDVYKNDNRYKPNEDAIKIGSLETFSTQLKDANINVINAITTTKNADLQKRTTLYHPQTGLCALAALVKKYVKGLFGATSLEFRQISGLEFRSKKL